MIVLNSPAERGAWRVVVLLACASLSTACSGGTREELDRGHRGSEPASVEQRREVVERETKPNTPQRAPGREEQTPVTGEVPQQLLTLFRDDLARRALVKPETITVVSAAEQQWPDGSLGCAKPGQVYTQMIVPGYRVVLQAAGEKYAYHSDQRGNFVVCASGLALPPAKQQMKSPASAE